VTESLSQLSVTGSLSRRGRSAAASGREPAEHRTVARVMSILELVLASGKQGMRLGQLSASIDAPKSSVHGLAKGLVAIGYFREGDGRYFAGPAISSLLATGPGDLHTVYLHALEKLASEWNETAILATLVGDMLVYTASVESDHLIRVVPQLHKRLPLWPRSAGKCFLAFMQPKRLSAYIRRTFDASTDIDALQSQLAAIRQTRIGINIGESVAEHIGVASPVFSSPDSATIALVVVGPRARMEGRVDAIAASIRETAGALSYQIPGT
jgi:DNA-binding IclR family transcriptional regulator